MKKIYTLFIGLFLLTAVSTYGQSKQDIYELSKRSTMEIVRTLDLNREQQMALLDDIVLFETNKPDYENHAPSPYTKSKFRVMREKYATDLLPKVKELLTDEQFARFEELINL